MILPGFPKMMPAKAAGGFPIVTMTAGTNGTFVGYSTGRFGAIGSLSAEPWPGKPVEDIISYITSASISFNVGSIEDISGLTGMIINSVSVPFDTGPSSGDGQIYYTFTYQFYPSSVYTLQLY